MRTLQSISGIGDSCYFGDRPLVCLTDQYASAFGSEGLFGLLIGAVLFMAFYVAGDGDMATPTVALILTGSVLMPTLPGQYSQIGMYVVVIGLGAALWQVIQKYTLSPATQ